MTQTSTKRKWRHPSVLSLLKASKSKDPTEVIRRKARDTVNRARELGWSGPPFDPLILASILGIKSRSSTELFSAEAQLTPQPNRQLLLEFNPDRPDGRRNYSVCHEITHTFFDDCFDRVHHRSTNRNGFHPDDEVEYLCQIGASELLMPKSEFEQDMDDGEFSLSAVPNLRERYGASREAVIRRMVYLSDQPCVAVFLSSRPSPREKDAAKYGDPIATSKMRIVYSVPSGDFQLYLPVHKSVPENSCINSVFSRDVVTSAVERWEIPGFGDWKVEAIQLGVPDDTDDMTPTVAALVIAD